MRPDLFSLYDPDEWTLIPLRRPTDVMHVPEKRRPDGTVIPAHTRKDGKRPQHFNWTTRDYDTRAVLRRLQRNGWDRNVGVRLKANQLVIDVDPRNGGNEGFTDLCLELGIDPSIFPRVVTGSGGSHYYMRKPADVRVLDTIDGFPGVEFKSKGRQVVAAGSVHPETMRHYVFASDSPPLSKLPDCPPHLLRLITRPQRSVLADGGEANQEEIARALSGLDPTEFRNQKKWLSLMMACHHASAGEARHEFIEWSVSDPLYFDRAEEIGRRWDSLHKNIEDGVTVATLNHYLREANRPDLTIATAAADFREFDESDDWLEGGLSDADDGVPPEIPGGYSAEGLSALQELNKEYCAVLEGSKFVIVAKRWDAELERHHWVRIKERDFINYYCNRRIEKTPLPGKEPETVALGNAWIKWPLRNQRKGVIFDPVREHPDLLNLWTDFSYSPSKTGSWERLKELIFEVLCDGKQDVYDYVLNWLRYMFQFPAERAQVALVFRGGQGVGKGTLGNAICKVIGRHAMPIASPDLISGRFNSHLQDLIFLFADEAIRPEDRASESRIKHLITEPRIAYEGKGRDALLGRNYMHIMMATNEQWAIRAAADERRYLVSDANAKWRGQRAKFDALWSELESGGYARLLFDMRKDPLPPNWRPYWDIPQTAALIDEKLRNLSPLGEWLYQQIQQLTWLFPTHETGGQTRCFTEEFYQEFDMWQRQKGIKPRSQRDVTRELQRLLPGCNPHLRERPPEGRDDIRTSPSDGRAPVIALPSWGEARDAFEKWLKGNPGWETPLPENDDDWLR